MCKYNIILITEFETSSIVKNSLTPIASESSSSIMTSNDGN